MFIVLALSSSEQAGSNGKDVYRLSDKTKLDEWLLSYRGDIKRLEIFDAKKVNIVITVAE
jgi:hypothetical protein